MRTHPWFPAVPTWTLLTLTLILFPGCGSDAAVSEGNGAADCLDGVDNDRDGLIDCADPGCGAAANCVSNPDGGVRPDTGPVACGPSNCSTCCRANGTCALTGLLGSECGSGGAACSNCGAFNCAPPGVCSAPTGCSVTLPASGPATDTCTGANICICPGGPDSECTGTGTCAVASGRSYLIELDYILADTTKPDGSAWDVGGGAPDPYAVVTLNSIPRGPSTYIPDTFNAQWADPVPSWTLTLTTGSNLRIDAWDDDISDDDWMGACAFASLTVANLRAREFACAATSADIRAYIQPL
ncbi:MAG: hypothetical protein KC593_01005 [Myxococcales bacterium]|nr:hypothetical protein [Myxococcales bacterium]